MRIVDELTGTLGYVLFQQWRRQVLYGAAENVTDPQYGVVIQEIEKMSVYSDFQTFKDEFETHLALQLQKHGYQKDTGKKSSPTALFRKQRYRFDFVRRVSGESRIGIEVEKTERRFGVRNIMKLLLAFSWENSLLDVGIIIFPYASHASGSKHAVSSLREINNFLIPVLSQFHLWVIKNNLGIIVVDWKEN